MKPQGKGEQGKRKKPQADTVIPFPGVTPKKKRKPYNQAEYRLHKACVTWMKLFYPEEWKDCWHYPARPGSAKHGYFLKQMDVKEGIWDYCVDHPRNGYDRLHIDFKATTDLSEEQQAFRERNKHRFAFEVVKSLDEFEKVIENYLGESPRKKNYFR